MKKVPTRVLMLLSAILLLSSSAPAQNFVTIGSSEAPIRYIKGTGSNVGLIVGVEYKPNTDGLARKRVGCGCILHVPGGGAGGSGFGGKGDCQPFGKRIAGGVPYQERYTHEMLNFDGLSKVKVCQNRATVSRSLAGNAYDPQEVQLKPLSIFKLNETGITELVLPALCLEQRLPVPEASADTAVRAISLSDTVNRTYDGIYRFDEYLNQRVIGKVTTDGLSFSWVTGSLSDAEIEMLMFANLEIDSTAPDPSEAGFYGIKHAYLNASHANYVIWAARHNQDSAACRAGMQYMASEYGNGVLDEDFAQAIFHLNNLVFTLAGMPEFSRRFAGPEGAPRPFNLKPLAYIRWYPERFETENQQAGVKFTAQHSIDADGRITSYRWDFGTGDTSGLRDPVYRFPSSSPYRVILTVRDDSGAVAFDTIYTKTTGIVGTRRAPLAAQGDRRAVLVPVVSEKFTHTDNPFQVGRLFSVRGCKVGTIDHAALGRSHARGIYVRAQDTEPPAESNQ